MHDDVINFYGLLYIDRKRNLDANIKRTVSDPLDIDISCAALAAKSAQAAGVSFGLFTNNSALIKNGLREKRLPDFPVEEIRFALNVPSVKNFYSAHFKIDVIKALASGKFGRMIGLIDIDAVFCRQLPPDVREIAHSALAAYDVSDEVFPQHGRERSRRDLELVANSKFKDPKWFGGEFLVGTDANMGVLSEEIENCWPRYVENIKLVHRHHIGDEMTVSAALNLLLQRGFPVLDMGKKGVVARWWSARTEFPQPAFEEIEDSALLHLPSDKAFLAEQAKHAFTRVSFLENYKTYAGRKLATEQIFHLVDTIFFRNGKVVPAIRPGRRGQVNAFF